MTTQGDRTSPEPRAAPQDESTPRGFVLVLFKGRRVEVYVNPDQLPLVRGEMVVVEVERGWDIGEVAILNTPDLRRRKDVPLRPILRPASTDECAKLEELRSGEGEALDQVKTRVTHFDLPMHLIDAEYQADGNRITFYFTAEHRIDFRDLVRDLAGIFRTRIELRQIGTREAARRLGGLGSCGRELCCGHFLCDFERVTLHMARAQRLVYNPARLSGLCGRLLCCLTYEIPHRSEDQTGEEPGDASSDGKLGFPALVGPSMDPVDP
jgi:cell fate regulator YaaT (PSP1 superfamily)